MAGHDGAIDFGLGTNLTTHLGMVHEVPQRPTRGIRGVYPYQSTTRSPSATG